MHGTPRPHDWVLTGKPAHALWFGGSNDGKTAAREEVLIRLKSKLGETHSRTFKMVIALHSTLDSPVKRDWRVLGAIKKELMPEIVTSFPATEQGLKDALDYVRGQKESCLLGTEDEVCIDIDDPNLSDKKMVDLITRIVSDGHRDLQLSLWVSTQVWTGQKVSAMRRAFPHVFAFVSPHNGDHLNNMAELLGRGGKFAYKTAFNKLATMGKKDASGTHINRLDDNNRHLNGDAQYPQYPPIIDGCPKFRFLYTSKNLNGGHLSACLIQKINEGGAPAPLDQGNEPFEFYGPERLETELRIAGVMAGPGDDRTIDFPEPQALAPPPRQMGLFRFDGDEGEFFFSEPFFSQAQFFHRPPVFGQMPLT